MSKSWSWYDWSIFNKPVVVNVAMTQSVDCALTPHPSHAHLERPRERYHSTLYPPMRFQWATGRHSKDLLSKDYNVDVDNNIMNMSCYKPRNQVEDCVANSSLDSTMGGN